MGVNNGSITPPLSVSCQLADATKSKNYPLLQHIIVAKLFTEIMEGVGWLTQSSQVSTYIPNNSSQSVDSDGHVIKTLVTVHVLLSYVRCNNYDMKYHGPVVMWWCGVLSPCRESRLTVLCYSVMHAPAYRAATLFIFYFLHRWVA